MAEEDLFFRLATVILLTVTALFIIIGNSVNLIVLHRVKNFNEVTKTFMKSLAFADLGIGCVLNVLSIGAAAAGHWPFGDGVCGFYGVALVFLEPASLLTLVIISAERYLAVMRPFQYPSLLTLTRARIIVVIAWLSALIFALFYGPLLGRVAVYYHTFHMCFYDPADPTQLDIWGISSICIFVILPFVLIVCIYLRLYLVARRHARQIADSGQQNQAHSSSESKRTITFLIITAGFAVAWTPFATSVLYANFALKRLSPYLGFFCQVMYLSNSWLNVIVYYWKNRAFREELQKIIESIFGRRSNGGNATSHTATS
ncbi:histamine H2 receptor-like [Amphiura filiformis]|uniref:histamine H2 receptor-like n=1 Tax=Amphiura filiformis TaxID=82378 RepID=UPI003B2139E5